MKNNVPNLDAMDLEFDRGDRDEAMALVGVVAT
jgi:hypothetical protein